MKSTKSSSQTFDVQGRPEQENARGIEHATKVVNCSMYETGWLFYRLKGYGENYRAWGAELIVYTMKFLQDIYSHLQICDNIIILVHVYQICHVGHRSCQSRSPLTGLNISEEIN